MNTNKLYSLADLTDYVVETYHLPTYEKRDANWKTYRQQIYRTLINLNLWENGIEKTTGKKAAKYFTEEQRQLLLTEPSFYDYVREKSSDEAIYKSKRYADIQRDIATRREAHIDYLNSLETGTDENLPCISNEAFRRKKNDVMLKALFELFFTPLDEELLMNDLWQTQLLSDELSLEPKDIEAEHRLNSPEGNYYKRKENPFEKEQPSLKTAKSK